tara:strand:- start:39 stop:584 length:546 start_codon:yes stop_codon:yes gene_type:complete
MKKLFILLLLFLPLIINAQKTKIKKGTAYIIPMGNGVYQSTITGRSGFTGTGNLKTHAIAKAQEFAKEKNAEYEVISFETIEQSFMVFPQATMTFRLVYISKEINDPDDPNSVTITRTGNLNNNNSQTVIKTGSSENKIDNEKEKAVKELKSLKELLDLNLINKEEFDKKAKELKKIILGN